MKDLHKIYGLYIGQEMLVEEAGKYHIKKISGIMDDFIWYKSKGQSYCTHYPMKSSKLILKPLEEITDEHAFKVGAYDKEEFSYWWQARPIDVFHYQIDQLREFGYDCGYKDIPKLLETDIAITMDEAKELTK